MVQTRADRWKFSGTIAVEAGYDERYPLTPPASLNSECMIAQRLAQPRRHGVFCLREYTKGQQNMLVTRVIAPTVMMATLLSSVAATAADVSGKVVLANLDRYDAVLKIGSVRREIKPKKASVLTPKRYPVTIQYWSGNTTAGWRKQTIAKAGIYGFNFQRGVWTLTELKRNTTRPGTLPVRRPVVQRRPSRTVMQQRIVRQPVRRLPINADRNRWSPLARVAYGAGKVYQFVRDEQDRDLLRHLLIRAREDEDLDRLDDWLRDAKIPELYKDELRDVFRDLADLDDKEWNEVDTADEKDWGQAKADLGDLISDADWGNIDTDFAEIDTDDYWEDDVEVDLDDIDFADNLDLDGTIDVGEGLDLDEGVDVDDLDIDTDHYDLADYDDHDGYDGVQDVDPGDYGGDDFGDDDFGDFGGGDDFDF